MTGCVFSDLTSLYNQNLLWKLKIVSLIISNKTDKHLNPRVELMGTAIDEVDSHSYLGIRIATNLRWKDHIQDVATKARRKLNLMQPLKMKVDRKSLEIMYRSFVQPTMEYAIAVWGGTYDSDLAKLESIHLDAKRFITGATARSIIVKIDSEMPCASVQDRINAASLCMMYKITRGDAPQYLKDILLEINGQRHYRLRNNINIRVPYCRLETYKKSFSQERYPCGMV